MSAVVKTTSLSRCKTYRWALSRSWAEGPQVCWIMLNPSTADHEVDDPTIRRITRFTRLWGYAGFTVVNLYPFRSPSPSVCREWAESHRDARRMLRRNSALVARYARAAEWVVAAWGNGAWDPAWADRVVLELLGGEDPRIDMFCLGTTDGGAPKHPLARGRHRIPDDQKPILWRSGH